MNKSRWRRREKNPKKLHAPDGKLRGLENGDFSTKPKSRLKATGAWGSSI